MTVSDTNKGIASAIDVLVHPSITAIQRRHVLAFHVVPLVAMAVALCIWSWHPPALPEFLSIASLWLITAIGGTVCSHRLLAHGAFSCGLRLRAILAIMAMMGAQGPIVSWVATHRRHHQLSDREGDPHSPNLYGKGALNRLRGLWHAQIGWMPNHPYPNPIRYAPDLLRDSQLMWLNQRYFHWVAIGLIAPALVCGIWYQSFIGVLSGFLWGGLIRIAIVSHIISSVNSICHSLGHCSHETDDSSRNNLWLAIPTAGEAWHNNHHAYPWSAKFGHKIWQIDFGWYAIALLERCGLVWDVRRPPTTRVRESDMHA